MQNNDEAERVAEAWLRSQKLNPKKNIDDPPDYIIDGDIAVEVTRFDMDEESITKPLERVLKEVFEESSWPDDHQGWRVDVSCDVSRDLPEKKKTKNIIRTAIKELREQNCWEYLDEDSGIEISFMPGEHPGFSLTFVGPNMGEWLLYELKHRIQSSIDRKFKLVRSKADQHKAWWLLLVGSKNPVPNFWLSESEMKELHDSMKIPHPWRRVVVLDYSSKRVQVEWHQPSNKNPN